jgi:protein TonB
MRWSFWPVSITLHVIAVFAMLMVPLTAEVSWPVPAPIHRLAVATKVAPVPPEVVANVPAPRVAPNLPNVVAPTTLEALRDVPSPPAGFPVPGFLESAGGPVDPGLLGPSALGEPRPPAPPAPEPKPAAQILRVGQGIREPKRISGVSPEYPALARSVKVEGVVILEAVINERGEIERVKVLKSAPLLDAAAIAAVKDWRYTPTLLNGVPVSVLMTITVNFTLHD